MDATTPKGTLAMDPDPSTYLQVCGLDVFTRVLELVVQCDPQPRYSNVPGGCTIMAPGLQSDLWP